MQKTVLTWPEGLAHLSENLRRHADLQEGWQGRLKTVSVWRNLLRLMLLPSKSNRFQMAGLKCGCVINAKGKPLPSPQHVISAIPLMVAAHIVESPEQFGLNIPEYAPWLVSNFELHSFPKKKQQRTCVGQCGLRQPRTGLCC